MKLKLNILALALTLNCLTMAIDEIEPKETDPFFFDDEVSSVNFVWGETPSGTVPQNWDDLKSVLSWTETETYSVPAPLPLRRQ